MKNDDYLHVNPIQFSFSSSALSVHNAVSCISHFCFKFGLIRFISTQYPMRYFYGRRQNAERMTQIGSFHIKQTEQPRQTTKEENEIL